MEKKILVSYCQSWWELGTASAYSLQDVLCAYEKIRTRNKYMWVGDLPRLPVECFGCLFLLPSEDLLIDAVQRRAVRTPMYILHRPPTLPPS
jgi:hypothetical protein